jgi:hypothetical protein
MSLSCLLVLMTVKLKLRVKGAGWSFALGAKSYAKLARSQDQPVWKFLEFFGSA